MNGAEYMGRLARVVEYVTNEEAKKSPEYERLRDVIRELESIRSGRGFDTWTPDSKEHTRVKPLLEEAYRLVDKLYGIEVTR